MSLQRDRSGDGILVIFYTVNREHEMLLFKENELPVFLNV